MLRGKVIALVALIVIVLTWTVQSIRNPAFRGGDLDLVATMVTKDMNPDLFLRDYVFADDSLYRFYIPFYRWLMTQLWQATGSFELGLVWLAPMVLSLYVVGMFWLMRQVTGDSWLSLGVTVVSANYYPTMGAEIWGVAASSSMMARTIFTAVVPFLFVGLFAFLKNPSLLRSALLGFGIGLSANVHPISGLQLTFIVVGLLILTYGFAHRQWLALPTLLMAVAAGAAPVMLSFFASTGGHPPANFTFRAFSEIVQLRVHYPFSPTVVKWPLVGATLKRPVLDWLVWAEASLTLLALAAYILGRRHRPQILPWLWLLGGLTAVGYAYLVARFNLSFFFWFAALYIVYRFWRRDPSRLDVWLATMLGLISLFSFVGYYILTWVWQTFEIWSLTPLMLEQIRGARFVYLPLYLLVGRAGLSLALELKSRWHMTDITKWSGLTAAIGLVLGWGAVLSKLFWGTSLLSAILAFSGVMATMVGLAWLFSGPCYNVLERISPWVVGLAVVLIFFGPFASIASPYLPLPASNLWQRNALVLGQVDDESDAQMYEWSRANMPRDTLVYPCGLHMLDVLRFRHKAGRSITYALKDLNLGLYNRASLPAMYERYRKLAEACQDPALAIAAAHEVQADFIIVPANTDVNAFDEFICFQNDKYKVFTLNPAGCVTGAVVNID